MLNFIQKFRKSSDNVVMGVQKLLNALVIDPVTDSRGTMYALLRNEQTYCNLVFNGVTLISSFEDAFEHLKNADAADVVFISLALEIEAIATFIRRIKLSDEFGRLSFILVSSSATEEASRVAQGIGIGADGFLLLPCSIDQLRIVGKIGQRIKVEAYDRKFEAAAQMLVQSLTSEIDNRVEDILDERSATPYPKQLKHAVATLLQEHDDRLDRYLEILRERFLNSRPRVVITDERPPRSKRLQEKLKARNQKPLRLSSGR